MPHERTAQINRERLDTQNNIMNEISGQRKQIGMALG